MKTQTDSKGRVYKLAKSETAYDIDTPDEIIDILEWARISDREQRLKFNFGDVKTGKSWNEEHDTTGYIGRSNGSIKIPLLIPRKDSSGGGGLLTGCILKITDTKSKRVLYVHPLYKKSVVEIVPSDMDGYKFNTVVNGELYGRHKSMKSAQICKSKIE
jgi:hypothetical protein